jgi:hypothetical protein
MKTKFLTVFVFTVLLTTTLLAQKTIKANDILDDIKQGKNVSYDNLTIKGTLDMTFMDDKLPELPRRNKWFNNGGNNTVKETIEGSISFVNCVFEDNVFAYIHDEDSKYTFVADFENDVTFENCTFKANALFKYSDFEGNASFKGSEFQENSTFKYAKFDSKANFANTIFNENATFKYTKFKNGVSFNNARFQENLNIKYTKVNGDFNINGMKISYDIDSKYTDINGKGFSKYLLESKN